MRTIQAQWFASHFPSLRHQTIWVRLDGFPLTWYLPGPWWGRLFKRQQEHYVNFKIFVLYACSATSKDNASPNHVYLRRCMLHMESRYQTPGLVSHYLEWKIRFSLPLTSEPYRRNTWQSYSLRNVVTFSLCKDGKNNLFDVWYND